MKPPGYLTALDRWLLWRTTTRINRKTGATEHTKVPIAYATGKACDVTNPRNWETCAKVLAALQRSSAWDGPGFALGPIDGRGEIVIGIDLDSCFSADGTLLSWAMDFLTAMGSYAERSPSGTGIKCVARIAAADLDAARQLLGLSDPKHHARTRIFGPKPEDGHAPGAQLFLADRYFAITGEHWAPSPDDVTQLTIGQVATIAALFGPPPRQYGTNGATRDDDATEPDDAALRDKLGAAFLRNPRLRERWEGGTEGLSDTTRSGRDMSVLAMLVTAGFAKGEVRAALRLFRHGKATEEPERYFEQMWARTTAAPQVEPEPDSAWEAQHPGVASITDLPAAQSKPRRRRRQTNGADPVPPEFSENALSYLFSDRHAEQLVYCHDWGKWLRWTGRRWQDDPTVAVFDAARVICAEQAAIAGSVLKKSGAKVAAAINKAAAVAAIERLARHHHRHALSADVFDADLRLTNNAATVAVAERRGMIVIRDQQRDDFCTKQATVDPDFEADCPLWRAFLLRAMADDQQMVDYLQRVCGYCCTGLVDEHVLFFAYGTGANGKTTFANVLTGILGAGPSGYAAIAPISTFTASQSDQHPTDLAMLRGARLVCAQETEEGRAWAISKVKMMTGGDPVAARFMRQDFFTYRPQFKLLILGNHKPALHNVDEATRRRFHLIPFTVTIPPAERDRHLPEKLQAEYPAIFAWMLRGWEEWERIGLAPPDKVVAASAAYFHDEDNVAAWIAERCHLGKAFYDTLTELYPSWKVWAEAHGERPGTAKELAKALDKRPDLIRHNQPTTKRAGWHGLMVKAPPQRWPDPP